MSVLLDEILPHGLWPSLMPMHDVFTVGYLRWAGLTNGKLLARAASEQFDVLVTSDRGYAHQQNLARLPCSVVLLPAKSKKIDDVRPVVTKPLSTLSTLAPATFVKRSP